MDIVQISTPQQVLSTIAATSSPPPLQHDYTAAGINNVTHGSDHYDAIFLSLWDGMNGALLGNQPLVALNYLNLGVQGSFHNTYRVIAPHIQPIMDSYLTPARGEVNGSYLEYIVPRNIDGSNLLYYIYSLKETDGTWRINAM